ncbi:hypothetical protein [Paenibacillus camelliae]|uniref:hypothetical protein n=1 Tax=Paenibacillus camelliae TaxID=512410 RepID=UPI00203BD229|nr:hypothetical protein [Paenibacillus camelliae]MCM3633527.1 hypothetical protein [Paenibacillus camelliae]
MIDEIECHRYLYKFLKGTITLSELEQWLYNHEELEEILGKSVYFELISRDYKNKYALEDTKKQIKGLINIGFFEQERIINSLEKLIDTSEGYLENLEALYDDYCDGYTFLRYIALVYITTSDEYIEVLKQDKVKLKDYSEKINKEANRILRFFANNELRIVIENEYIDIRELGDRIELHDINEMLAERSDC